jgi:ABC-type cobalamin/Fe3+-siderophores transport system ATPase subunit
MARWFLDAVEISGGFLAGIKIELPPGLTCVIGPRGSGKSTLLEAIRFGVGGLAGASKARQDLVQANLSQAVVAISTIGAAREPGYTIRRAVKQPATLITPDGKSVTSVDLDRGTFLPVDAYSSTEIEAIADESLGSKRRALLDELRSDQFGRIQLSLAEKNRALEANADSIRSLERRLADATERIEELSGARSKLQASPAVTSSEGTDGLLSAAKQYHANEQEESSFVQTEKNLRQLVDDVSTVLAKVSNINKLATSVDSKNKLLFDEAEQLLTTAAKETAAQIATYSTGVDAVLTSFDIIHKRLRTAHDEQRAFYAGLQATNQAAGDAVRRRHEAELAVAELEKIETLRDATRQQLDSVRESRKALKGEYLIEREQISSLRQEVATNLQSHAGDKVRIRVLRNADSSGYRAMLLDALKGARVRNHDEIIDCIMRLRPEQLAQIIVDNDVAELETHTSLGDERCKRVLDAYQAAIDPLTLEVMPVDDRVTIELNVSSSADPLFKDASELSRGQKCTALLPLLLARRDSPLLIDQPEDNLDNHFIYETVVETIHRLKARRQMIFVTHNANIPVLAEADMVVVLNSDGKRGLIEKVGSLDECQEQIIDLLEGGREAFELRRQRYQK